VTGLERFLQCYHGKIFILFLLLVMPGNSFARSPQEFPQIGPYGQIRMRKPKILSLPCPSVLTKT
jgi:hypothetical protein